MIYLASTSPRRKQLLKEAGISFRVLRPDYHEKNIRGASPSKLVQVHAFQKAASASKKIKNGVVIGADTVVFFHGKIIGKPKNKAHAFRVLSLLQGKKHRVYTGVALLKISESRLAAKCVFVQKTAVRLQKMKPAQIARYFKRVNPLDKAGAYAIQSRHAGIVEKVEGSFSNAVGLPMEVVSRQLEKFVY